MGEALRKFVPRAFRYVLRPQDRNGMRFSLEHSRGTGGIERTTLLNLSESGVAFLMSPGMEPHVGERIKVEIPIPNGEQIAWWARVVRVQEHQSRSWFASNKANFHEQPQIFVALRFEELPEPHTRALRKGLEQSFMKAMRDQHYRNWLYYRAYVLHNIWRWTLYSVLTAAALGFIYYFAQPSANYDKDRGALWGDRFKF